MGGSAHALEERIDPGLDERGDVGIAEPRPEAAEPLLEQSFDLLVLALVALEEPREVLMVPRERRGPVVGHDGHLVVGGEPFASERDERIEFFRRTDQSPAAEDDQKDAALRGDGCDRVR